MKIKMIFFGAMAAMYVNILSTSFVFAAEGGEAPVDALAAESSAPTLESLENQLLTLQDRVDNLSDATLVYFACAMAFLAILLAIVTLCYSLSADRQMKRKQKEMARDFKRMDDLLSELDGEVQQLKKVQEKGASSMEQSAIYEQYAQPSYVRSAAPQPVLQRPVPQKSTVPQNRPSASSEVVQYQEFITAYNAFQTATETGFAMRARRDEFLRQYHLQGISCVNYAARMSNARLPLEFRVEESTAQAQYWAFALPNGRYAVVPNLREYEEQQHLTAGGRELFQSNFQSGSYRKIRVIRPAIFNGLQTLGQQGVLQLAR